MVWFSYFTSNEMFSLKMSHSSSRPDIHPQHFPTQDETEGDFFLVVMKIGGVEDFRFGGCKNCKDALSPSTFYWIQTRKCVMNYEKEGIHWRIKIQLSSFADISWGTASKYLRVVPKNALSKCCWGHSALAQSPFAGIPCVWRLIFWSFLTKAKQDRGPPSHVNGKI